MNGQIVWEHFRELQREFPNVSLSYEKDKFYVRGEIQFLAQYLNNEQLHESYSIELELSSSYPKVPPVSRELEGRIPDTFHTFSNGTLCLGAPLAIKITFSKNPTLLGFLNSLLIPYLYSFTYMVSYKNLPYGELDHGAKGIINYYMELFQVVSIKSCLEFLYILASQKYRGHLLCPCDSGNILRKCHGPLLLELHKYQDSKEFGIELIECLEYVKKNRK